MFELEDRYWWFTARRALAIACLDQFAAENPAILDLGCGTGAVLQELAPRGWAVGMDLSPHALAFCQTRQLKRLVCGDAQHIPFADASFDAVIALDVLEHVPDDRAAFHEIARVLKPGGILVLNVPAFGWLWGPHDVALMHFRRYRRSDVASRLAEAGLHAERLSYSVFWLFPVVIFMRVIEKLRRGPAKAKLPPAPGPLNRWLERLMHAETRRIRQGRRYPWGSSVVGVARKR